jgi:chromosome segregation ATPase
MALPPPEPPKQLEAAPAGTIATRMWDAVKKLATITELLLTLEREDARIQAQLLELSRTVFDLSKDVHDVLGQMKGIEKRLEDKDKLIEATIKLRIMEEVKELRKEFGVSG